MQCIPVSVAEPSGLAVTRPSAPTGRGNRARSLVKRVLLIVGTVVSLWHQAASADVDLNGLWRVGVWVTDASLTFSDVCWLNVAQTGTTLLLTGVCQNVANPVSVHGTIDSGTGGFSANGSAGLCANVLITGNVAIAGTSFTGTFYCSDLGVTGGVNASRCGNGHIEAGEAWGDDGNPCTVNDRCVAGTCRTEPVVCPPCLACNVTAGCVPSITNGCKQS